MNSSGPNKQQYSSAINNKIGSLPLLPSVVSQLLALSPDDDDFLDQVYHLARQEPTFSITLVQYAAKTSHTRQNAENVRLKHADAILRSRHIPSIVATTVLLAAL